MGGMPHNPNIPMLLIRIHLKIHQSDWESQL